MGRIPGFNGKHVRVSIPRKLIIRAYNSHELLTQKENTRFVHKKREIDRAILRLKHVRSIIEKILLRVQPDHQIQDQI